ncbi:hypothetical protein GCM10023148_30880 [Actinokineospora soli]
MTDQQPVNPQPTETARDRLNNYTPPPLTPFQVAIEGWSPNPDSFEFWPNSVRVEAVEGYQHRDTDQAADETEWEYADNHGTRQLVEIDTNYKPSRDSEHPVRLTRTDTVQLAAHLLTAVEDTFHFSRVGRLRATEAAELLRALTEVGHALDDLRSHALDDLLHDTGADPDEQETTHDVTDTTGGGEPR